MTPVQQAATPSARVGFRVNWKTVAAFLAVIGPGIITANADNDAGGITTYSLAGCQFGYTMLWTLIPITLVLILVQEMCARMGAITGKGLSDLIRENFGLKVTVMVLVGLMIADIGTTAAEFSGIAASMDIFGVNKYVAVPLSALFVWWLVVRGSYKTVEKYFLTSCLFYLTYCISGYLGHPPWGQVLHDTVVPSFDVHATYISMLIGVIGTTITPWMQFYIQSSVVEKRIKPEQYAMSKWDVIVGCIITDVVAFFIIVACAATVYAHGQGANITDARQVAVALQPLAGALSSKLFAFGLFNASVLTASILPLATAYCICEGMGWEAGIDRTFKEAPAFFSLYTAFIVIGAAIVLIPNVPLLQIMLWSQVVNGLLIAPVLVFMLKLVNKKRIMGDYINSATYNVISWAAVVVMIVLTALLIVTTINPNLLGGS